MEKLLQSKLAKKKTSKKEKSGKNKMITSVDDINVEQEKIDAQAKIELDYKAAVKEMDMDED